MSSEPPPHGPAAPARRPSPPLPRPERDRWYEEELERVVAEAVATLWASQGTAELWLYFCPGLLIFAPEAPLGCELAIPERCPRHLERGALFAWVRARTGRVPCFPGEIDPAP